MACMVYVLQFTLIVIGGMSVFVPYMAVSRLESSPAPTPPATVPTPPTPAATPPTTMPTPATPAPTPPPPPPTPVPTLSTLSPGVSGYCTTSTGQCNIAADAFSWPCSNATDCINSTCSCNAPTTLECYTVCNGVLEFNPSDRMTMDYCKTICNQDTHHGCQCYWVAA